MIFYFTSRVISSFVAFLYPGYASYKTLSQRPASEEDLERWLMYWSVLGCVVAVEYVAEWLISWIPLYYTVKTIFLLYLALPQTKGSSYLYVYHLQPFFHSHESQIDATLASVKTRVYTFLQERLRALWEQIAASIGQQQANTMSSSGAVNSAPPPTLNNPASGPAQLAASFWTSYGPSILASGTALLRQTAAAAASRPSANPMGLNTPPGSTFGVNREREERRRQLQAQLDALEHDAAPAPNSVPIPPASPQVSTSRHSSDSDIHVRERTTSGRFEEIGIPSDVEGYDMSEGSDTGKPSVKRGNSWFGWGGSSSNPKGGYERVKSE